MDGAKFFSAIEAAKGAPIVAKHSRTGTEKKPSILTLRFSDGTEVSFPRRDALAIKSDDEMAAFIARLLG